MGLSIKTLKQDNTAAGTNILHDVGALKIQKWGKKSNENLTVKRNEIFQSGRQHICLNVNWHIPQITNETNNSGKGDNRVASQKEFLKMF